MAQQRLSHPEPVEPPLRPRVADQPSRFVLLEREVELEYRPQMLAALQRKLNTVAEEIRAQTPECPRCGLTMSYHDARPVTWLAHLGATERLSGTVPLCALPTGTAAFVGFSRCGICGSLARRLGLLAAVAPYELV